MRAFLAIEIKEEIKETILRLIEKLSFLDSSVRWVKRENIHLTLWFFEELKEDELENVSGCIESVTKKTKPFQIAIKGSGYFGKRDIPKVVFLSVEGEKIALKTLFENIKNQFSTLNIQPDKDFHPHITLLRNRSGRSLKKVINFLLDMKDFSLGSFTVEGITLFKSDLQKGGAIHTPIKKFEFGGKN